MREYPDGLDCVWLATDRNGHLGAFVTGGSGPIPVSATSDSSFPIEDIEAAVCELPQISETRLLVQMKRPDDFIDIAQRGFFVYDWRDVHRTTHDSTHVYEPVAVPLNPITLDALPESIRRLAVDATLRDSAFVEEQALDVMAMLECLSAD
ncbi:MAG: hypothetical protein EKK49_00540 [Rhodocyclaceae bacterium]|nr:MAG: hypothetical protein EKK49_00540 [Rhodocyclaceae bacterium]